MTQNERSMTTFALYAKAGYPRWVLARKKASGFDCEILKKKVFVRDASPIPVHPWRQPFLTACGNRKLPLVRLLLELGADPDADCCAWTICKTPRQNYANNQLPVQISMLRCFISAYNTSGHQPFIENAIATLFREMLCACMEV